MVAAVGVTASDQLPYCIYRHKLFQVVKLKCIINTVS